MSSQKKSSTKGKGMTPSSPGQRQGSNSKKSRSVSMKANVMSKPVKAPVSKMSSFHTSRPIQSLMDRGILVKHCELVSSLVRPQSVNNYPNENLYQMLRLRCNPGSKKTFNWLSSIAVQYEFYKFRKLKFHFVTRQSTSHPGGIIMSPDYDAADGQIPLTEQTVYNNRGTVDGPVWQDLCLNVDVSSMNRLFKSHVIMSDERFFNTVQDEKTIDSAQVFVLTDDTTPGVNAYGKCFVEYEVELTEPQIVTEPPNKGGASYNAFYGGGQLLNNSSRPINSIFTNILDPLAANPALKIDEGLASPLYNIPSVSLPTATLMQFAKDWEGILTTKVTGTGLASDVRYFKAPSTANPNDAAGVGDTELASNLISVFGAAGTAAANYAKGSFKAGEFLKIMTPNATSITNFVLELGAQSFQNIY